MFTDGQYGFRVKRSSILQLLDILDDLTSAYDEGKQTDIIYLDIKKAFDTVPHKRQLLLKIKAYVFGNEIVYWIKDFLKGRKQIVNVFCVCFIIILIAPVTINLDSPDATIRVFTIYLQFSSFFLTLILTLLLQRLMY